MDGWVDKWVGGWVNGSMVNKRKSRYKDINVDYFSLNHFKKKVSIWCCQVLNTSLTC